MALGMLESGFASCSGRQDLIFCKSYTDVEKNAVFSFTRIHNHTTENGKQDAQDYHGFSPFV